ncbi:hypothetical protein BH10PLA2_BH10PLA2_09640 [soil metagenome]
MAMHDWNRVKPGIYHHFHHEWISEIQRWINQELEGSDYYALAEQQAGGFGPDILTLQLSDKNRPATGRARPLDDLKSVLVQPRAHFMAQADIEFYSRKKSHIALRHVSDDRLVAVVEIVSPGNKASVNSFRSFVDKLCDLIEQRINLLVVDPFPPGKRDPAGIHGAIWERIAGDSDFVLPPDRPLTFAAYESSLLVKAFCEMIAVGVALPSMPLILEPDAALQLPLELCYARAFAAVPKRWRDVLEPQPG